MVKHLRLKHSKEFELAGKKQVQSFPSISETSVASTTNTVQSNIIHALNKKKLWNIDDHRSIRIHKIIGKLITLDIQPFSIVEDTGFNELICLPKLQITILNIFQPKRNP